uniref:histidine--tRNA ligase n=1 Tax=Schizymenia dubyi TaxID=38368 RepID=A0A1C9C9I0_9FLOR|nr:histidine-tRNA synthetase [Schizymenia dubyi]AOM65031.1 histidine-tRNA synthetase [Schizymenia dubyi]
MQPLRGTKDILPRDIILWQHLYNVALRILSLSNYQEIRTPILEATSLFERSIGEGTDIINKEMYSFTDQGKRHLTLRPEGTACIARSFISNKLYQNSHIQRLWYLGPMFRYERPQNGRQRQFHQLGIECMGSKSPMADAEVIRLANNLLKELKCKDYRVEINSIGNIKERKVYQKELIKYLEPYESDLDHDSQKRLITNPLRILDSKNTKTQEILQKAPALTQYLDNSSIEHFDLLCNFLNYLGIEYTINNKLIRGLDYYNYTAFEIKTDSLGTQDTICGGGRYDSLIQQLGGPDTPSVGWAIGIERLLSIIQNEFNLNVKSPEVYLATQGIEAQKQVWGIVNILEKENISFELDLDSNSFQKQLKKANRLNANICLILGDNEIKQNNITIKQLNTGVQKVINYSNLIEEIKIEKTVLA